MAKGEPATYPAGLWGMGVEAGYSRFSARRAAHLVHRIRSVPTGGTVRGGRTGVGHEDENVRSPARLAMLLHAGRSGTIGPFPDGTWAVDPPSMEGIAILLGSSVGVLSVLGGVLILIAKFTGGADEQ
jgi:hypothetical protein